MQPDDVVELDRLKEKTGKDLDREYLDALVRHHENTLDNLILETALMKLLKQRRLSKKSKSRNSLRYARF